MTRQESFKRRVRARMVKTGEKYGAARRALIDQSDESGRRWVSQPEMADAAVREATGRGWDEWCGLIDAWADDATGHSAVVSYLIDDHAVDGWWAQTVTVGWERITGRRLPYQRPDGTFAVSKSRTMQVHAADLRQMLLSDTDRVDLFPGFDTNLRSRPTTKTLRLGIGGGYALFDLAPVDDVRTKVTVSHEGLTAASEVEGWRDYWDRWLEAIDEG
ncbi:MAG TPA: hypothetical protein VMS74_11040 [Acidimicrobiia bacterium]|nr:hypothetical protein [Acidimicrobiia bacterium]